MLARDGAARLGDAVQRLLDWVYGVRDGLLSDARFQRWASSMPVLRTIARRQARGVFDLCAGFVYSQVLAACLELGLLQHLRAAPRDIEELGRLLDLPPASTRSLLDAAVAIGLASRRGEDRYGLGLKGAALLGNPGIAPMIEHHRMLYSDLADPVALLRGARGPTRLSRFWAYAGAAAPGDVSRAGVGAYTRLMAETQSLVADEILSAYPMERHRCLLDIGGGNGSFLRSVAARAPDVRLILFDLPAVVDEAREALATAGLNGRVRCVGGDFLRDPLPTGADVASLVRVVHDHDDGEVARLLSATHAALTPGGTLIVAEPLAETSGAEGVGAYFSLYLLAMGSGRPRSYSELHRLLSNAGFGSVRRIATRVPLQTSLIAAVRHR